MSPSASATPANGLRRWRPRLLPARLWDSRIAPAILVLAGIAMLGLLFYVSRWLTFWWDEWDFVVGRPDPSVNSIFEAKSPDTLLATLTVIYQAILHIFGLRTYLPYLLVDWLVHFVCVGLVYHIVARRSGTVLGLMAGLSLLLLGSAYEDLLQPFQMQYLLAGAGGLLALDRLLVVEADPAKPHSRQDLIVAVLALVFAVLSSSVGPIFVGLIVVWAVLRRDWAALLMTAPAIVLYGIWYVLWAGESQGPSSTGDFILAAGSLLYGLGAATCGVVGLPPERFGWVGTLMLAAAAACVAVAVIRGLRPAPLAAAAFLALIAEYVLQAFFRGSMGVEHAARSGYLYPAALFIWLAISGIVGRGLDRDRWLARGRLAFVPAVACLLIVPMVTGNMAQFIGAARGERPLRATELAELRLVEAVRSIPGVDLDISPDPDYIPQLTGRTYLTAIERFGAPTLAWDWESSADSQSVNLAAVRLLGPSIRTVAPLAADGSAPQLEVKGGSAERGTSSGCSLVRPSSPDATVSIAINDGQAFWLHSPPAGALLMVGVVDKPSAAMDGPVGKALASGQAVILPSLPAPYRWQAQLVSLGTQSFEVCTAPA